MDRMLKTAFLALVCLLSADIAVTARETVPDGYTVNSGWKFSFSGDSLSRSVSFPHTWNAADVADDVPGYRRGKGIYRKKLNIPTYAEGKRIYLYFEGANQETEVSVDGKDVCGHKGGYTAFTADITDNVKAGGSHEIEISVDNSHNPDIPPLSADYNFYGGIYRDVYLKFKEPVCISYTDNASSGLYISTPQVSEAKASVSIDLMLSNYTAAKAKTSVEFRIIDPDGRTVRVWSGDFTVPAVAENFRTSVSSEIAEPRLWSPDSPALYKLVATLRDRRTGVELDSVTETFGLRWFRFDPDEGFFLNGKHLKLIGTSRHQCYRDLGWALDDARHVADIRLLKEMGGNFLRVSHYPQDPQVLAMCDKLGILASVEIPVVNAVTGSEAFSDNSVAMAREMVLQSFNRPSVIIWAYMNEVLLRPPYREGTPEFTEYLSTVHDQAVRLENTIRELDPYRETMLPFHSSMKRYEEAGMMGISSTVGWNWYFGWYGGKFSDLDKAMERFHEKYPSIPMMISEYGADVDNRIHDETAPESFGYSVEYGDMFQEYYLDKILSVPYVAGAFLWNLNEFYSEPRSGAVPHVNLKGVTTLDRRPKNTWWLYKANLTDTPFVKFADSGWTARAGAADASHKIKVYANVPEAELFLNGEKAADLKFAGGRAVAEVRFMDGINVLSVRTPDMKLSDVLNIRYNAVPVSLADGFTELDVLLGTSRSFTDMDNDICWIPEQPYVPGSWGYIGGEPYRAGSSPAAEINIIASDIDPLYQTQRRGIEAFRADVPDGKYAVYLHWAELVRSGGKLVYNLGRDAEYESSSDRVFSVSVNGRLLLENLDVMAEVGPASRYVMKTDVDVAGGEGITVSFGKKNGETMLSAVRIVKLD